MTKLCEHEPAPIHSDPAKPSLIGLAKAAIALEIFLGIGALGGGGELMLGFSGDIISLPVSAA